MTADEDRDTRDKVIALGQDVKHLNEKLDEAIHSLDEVKEMMSQTKGAWKVLLGAAGFMGFISGLASWIIPPFFHR